MRIAPKIPPSQLTILGPHCIAMKHLIALSLALCSIAGAFDIPKGSHHLGQLEAAAKKAAKAKQPIAFVIAKKSMIAT